MLDTGPWMLDPRAWRHPHLALPVGVCVSVGWNLERRASVVRVLVCMCGASEMKGVSVRERDCGEWCEKMRGTEGGEREGGVGREWVQSITRGV
eukprot:3425623-Rhodomonas_salina.1